MRVLLVADGPEFAAEVIGFFRDLTEAELVGVAPSSQLADRYVARLDPDLVLLSLPLATSDGLEVLRQLGKGHDVPVVVLSLHSGNGYRSAVLGAGARELVAKGDFVSQLPAVVEELFRESEPRQPLARMAHRGEYS